MVEMFRNHAPASGADVESEAQQQQSQDRENQLQTIPIHNDNNNDDIHENDDHRSTIHLNRVSPYTSTRTIEENSTIDDQTIDAAVVEEIIEAVTGTPVPPFPTMNAANVRAEAELLPVTPNHLQHHATIPEVEPEIDIEEVHVVHHPPGANMSMISALSANTASIEQQQDTKLPPPASGAPYVASAPATTAFGGGTNFGQHQQQQYQQYQQRQNLSYPPISSPAGAAVPPPPMPRQVPITDYRGYSAGTASTNTPPAFKPPSIPIFTSAMMSSGRQISNNDMTAGNYSSSSNEQQQSCDDLPDYKDQARPMIPSGVPINASRNTSNNSGGTTDNTANWNQTNSDGSGQNSSQRNNNNNTNSDNDQEHIPVVAAILVPAERLAAEERLEEQWMQQQQRNYQAPHGGDPIGTESSHRQSSSNMSSGESTLTSSDTSRNNNNYNGDRSNGNNNHPEQHSNSNNTQRSKDTTTNDEVNSNNPKNSPMSERRFWITIIMAALLLNSLLVGGAVVGGFCAAGKCSSSSSSNKSNTVSSVDLPPLTNAPIPTVIRTTTTPVTTTNIPTPAPSTHDRVLSQIPSVLSGGPTNGKFESFPVAAEVPTPNPAFESVLISSFPTPGQFPVGIGSTTDDSLTDVADDTLIYEEPDDNEGDGGTAAPSQKMNVTFGTTITGTLPPTFAPWSTNITMDVGNETGSDLPETGPSAPVTEDSKSGDDGGGRTMKFAIFIPILVAVEAIIIIGLLLYYRYWKKQRQKYLVTDSDSCKTSPTTVSTTTSPNITAGTTRATSGEQQQSFSPSTGDTSSGSSSGSNGSHNSHDDRGTGFVGGLQQERVLSTIEECNSSCDQYSV